MNETISIRIPKILYAEIKEIADKRSKGLKGVKLSVPQALQIIVREHPDFEVVKL